MPTLLYRVFPDLHACVICSLHGGSMHVLRVFTISPHASRSMSACPVRLFATEKLTAMRPCHSYNSLSCNIWSWWTKYYCHHYFVCRQIMAATVCLPGLNVTAIFVPFCHKYCPPCSYSLGTKYSSHILSRPNLAAMVYPGYGLEAIGLGLGG